MEGLYKEVVLEDLEGVVQEVVYKEVWQFGRPQLYGPDPAVGYGCPALNYKKKKKERGREKPAACLWHA